MLRAVAPALLLVSTAFAAKPPLAPAAQSINTLGIELLQRVPGGNTVLSPYSIQLALAMAWEGAKGDTREQMTETLHYGDADIGANFSALRTDLAGIVQNAPKSQPVTLDVANRLFGQEGFAFRKPYLDLVEKLYGAPLEPLDFAKDPRRAAGFINKWVGKQTRDRIRDLIPPAQLTKSTRLVLANAVYFKASWQSEFEHASTRPLPFRLADGKSVSVPTMHAQMTFGYRKAAGYTAVSLPYAGSGLLFLILVPNDPAGLPDLERKLSAKTLAGFSRLRSISGLISLPRFKLEPDSILLGRTLKALGMTNAFDVPHGSADFDGIAPKLGPEPLYISDVIHKAFIAVDEKGTEAAAATAVMMYGKGISLPEKPRVEVRVDRPFLFAVQHAASGTCLFLGRVNDPR